MHRHGFAMNDSEKNSDFGKMVKRAREKADLAQGFVADLIEVSFATVARIEEGDESAMKPERIIRLAEVFGENPVEWLRQAGCKPKDISKARIEIEKLYVRQRLREIGSYLERWDESCVFAVDLKKISNGIVLRSSEGQVFIPTSKAKDEEVLAAIEKLTGIVSAIEELGG